MAGAVLTEVPSQVHFEPAGPDLAAATVMLSHPSTNVMSLSDAYHSSPLPAHSEHLEVSPYTDAAHLLDVHSIGISDRLFARALTILRPVDGCYATTSYESAFNWDEVFAYLRRLSKAEHLQWTARDFYVVEFRSKLNENIDRELLFKLDKESHREATESGGLLKYWFGSPNLKRRNLATCLWRSKSDAILGGKGPWHKQARGVIAQMYEEINVKGLQLTVDENIEGWSFKPWQFH